MSKVYLCCPTYDTTMFAFTASAFYGTPTVKHQFANPISTDSNLCHGFNGHWCNALNMRDAGPESAPDYFAMIHSDVGAPPCWLDSQIDDLEANQADVMSAVIPMKDESQETSTAVMLRAGGMRKLSLDEVDRCPPVFGVEHVPDAKILCVNTGLWVCDFRKPWVDKVWFETINVIHNDPVKGWTPRCLSEDWNFSAKCAALGCRVMASNRLQISHHGRKAWHSRPAATASAVAV